MGLASRILWGFVRLVAGVVLMLLVVVGVMAGLSYFAIRGEFDNSATAAEADSCEAYSYPSPPIIGLPQYSEDEDAQHKIEGVRYWTMRTFNSPLAMISNTYDRFAAGGDEALALASFAYSPRFMSEPDGAVRWAYRTDAEDLVTDVYYGRQDPGYLDVFVAFEGTNWSQWGDVLSNAAWFTSFFARNEYDVARDVFVAIQAKAKAEAAAGETVRYVVLGHSLGGGLAQHVAFGFPCVTAVVLDASFVINRHSYRQAIADPEVIHLGDRGEIFTFLRERQGLEDPLSSVITLIGGPFDGFMPGDRTQFHTVNATDVKTGPADFWQLFVAQHSVEVFVGTANDMLIDRYWEGEPGYQPFRLRCLSRLNRPDRCSQAQYCSEKDKNKVLQSLTGYDFAGMCNGSLIPPSSP